MAFELKVKSQVGGKTTEEVASKEEQLEFENVGVGVEDSASTEQDEDSQIDAFEDDVDLDNDDEDGDELEDESQDEDEESEEYEEETESKSEEDSQSEEEVLNSRIEQEINSLYSAQRAPQQQPQEKSETVTEKSEALSTENDELRRLREENRRLKEMSTVGVSEDELALLEDEKAITSALAMYEDEGLTPYEAMGKLNARQRAIEKKQKLFNEQQQVKRASDLQKREQIYSILNDLGIGDQPLLREVFKREIVQKGYSQLEDIPNDEVVMMALHTFRNALVIKNNLTQKAATGKGGKTPTRDNGSTAPRSARTTGGAGSSRAGVGKSKDKNFNQFAKKEKLAKDDVAFIDKNTSVSRNGFVSKSKLDLTSGGKKKKK